MHTKVDGFFDKAQQWKEEMKALRAIILDCGLTEDLKWSKPCYMYQGKNIVVIQGFKAYCAVLFFKGYLLSDPDQILVKTGENTHVGRQVRFNSVKEIVAIQSSLKACIYEAIEVERSGVAQKAPPKKTTMPDIPEELKQKLHKTPALKNAFQALTPGRQRAYILYFAAAKQSQTRESRIEKYIPQILRGKGLND